MPEAALTTLAAPSQPAAAAPAAAPAPTSQPAAAAMPAAAPAAAAQPSNLVSAAAPTIPEKFVVKRADGTIDHEATLNKTLGSYSHLEKRLGSGDVPPETEAGYKLDYAAFPAEVKISPEGEKAFLKSMHSAGMTNKQVQAVMNKYGEVIKQGLDMQKTQEAERVTQTLKDVEAELSQAWGESFQANTKAVVRGFNHLADDADKADMAKIGIDGKATYRILMKVLAKVGAGITEDTAVIAEGSTLDTEIESLRHSEAYLKADHPDHAAVYAKVTAWYNKKYPKK